VFSLISSAVSSEASAPAEPTATDGRPAAFEAPPHRPLLVYLDLCGLLLITVCASVLFGVYQFTALAGVGWGPDVARFLADGSVAAKVATSVWLGVLVFRHPGRRLIRPAAIAVAASTFYTNAPVHTFPHCPTGSEVTFTLALAWLTVEVLRRHGITPARFGIYSPGSRTAADRLRAWQIGQRVFTLTAINMAAVQALIWLLDWWGVLLPVMHTSQAAALGWTSHWQAVPDAVYSAVLEDVVIVGALTALLTLIRRPAREIYAIAIGLEIAGHLYFGLPALAMIPYVVLRLRLYQRHRQLLPLAAAHIAFDIGGGILAALPFPGRLLAAVPMILSVSLAERHLTTRAAADPAEAHTEDLPLE
jgi:hypothetical protein